MAIASNFPAIRPSLNLDFANSKALDPRISFSRASAASYYDGKTVAKAEENLLARSQEFDAASWNKTRISVAANATTAPDGTVTADFISQVAGQTDSGVVDQLPTMPNDVVTFSIYAKAEAKTFIVLRLAGSNTWFNLSAGVVATVGLGITASIAPFGNGWYRCVVSKNAFGFNQAAVRPADFDNSVTVTDSGGIYIWGAQLEQRSKVTAYTPTTTQPITNYVPVLQTAPAGVPRFDHNPVTGESLGLLVEEQRTNLLTYSYGQWANQAMVISDNVAIAPDGSLSAAKAARNTSSSIHGTYKSFATVVGTVYTYSAYVKAAENSRVRVSDNAFSSFGATFDLSTGAIIISGGSALLAAHAPVNVGNGWWRVAVSFTAANAITYPALCNLASSETGPSTGSPYSIAGDGYAGIYIWGAQLEAGEFPTSYIKTEASQVTRAADSASMTGANFSSWYRQDEGTLFADYLQATPSASEALLQFSDASAGTNRIALFADGLDLSLIRPGLFINTDGSQQAAIYYINATKGSRCKLAGAYKANDSVASFNGTISISDADCTIPRTIDRAYIGAGQSGNLSLLNGPIKRIAYYPKRLTDAQLQSLTA